MKVKSKWMLFYLGPIVILEEQEIAMLDESEH